MDHEPVGVILAAGRATRLRPLSDHYSKAMLPLLNRPMIAYACDTLRAIGITEVVVVTGPHDPATAAALQDCEGLRAHVRVQADHRGSGDAVLTAVDLIDNRPAIVLPVDALLVGDVAGPVRRFLNGDWTAGFVLVPVDDPSPYGVAVLEGDRIVDLDEKPERPRSRFANASPWMLRPAVLDRLRRDPVVNSGGEVDLVATIAVMLDQGASVGGWIFDGEWLDVGTIDLFLDAQQRLLAAAGPVDPPTGLRSTQLEGCVLIGAAAVVEDSRIADSVVGEGAFLRGVTLSRVLVSPGAYLADCELHDVVVTPDGRTAGPGAAASD